MDKKTIFGIFAAYVVMVVAFCAMSMSAWMIPHEYTDDNIRESLTVLSEEGRFPLTGGVLLWGKDNISDGTMYNIAVSGYDMTPIEAAIKAPWTYENGSFIHTAEYGLMSMNTQDGSVYRTEYSRYWHGYQFPLRLWSTILSIKGMRVLNSIALWGLLIATAIWLYRRYGKIVGFCWFIAFVVVGFPAVPLSLQYTACYYITFAAVLVMLWRRSLMDSPILFFIIGGCTSFLDLLTVPIMTIGIPLSIVVLSGRGSMQPYRLFVLLLAWGMGFGGIWMTKWLIGMAVYGLYDITGGGSHTIVNFLPAGFMHKYFGVTVCMLSLILALTVGTYLYMRKRVENKPLLNQLFYVSLLPFLWDLFFIGHTTAHIWFVYRNLTITAFCLGISVFSHRLSKL